jgi:hypothetical protein
VRIFANHSYSIRFLSYSPYRVKDFDKIVDLESLQKVSQRNFRPGQVVNNFIVNSHGFLSSELPYEKKINDYRIVFLGDSFLTGVTPYKYNFVHLTEEQLNQDKHTFRNVNFQTINLGMPGAGTGIYRKQFEVEGYKYHPDLVIVSFFVGNDFTDDFNNKKRINNLIKIDNNRFLKVIYESRLLATIINLYKIRFFSTYKENIKTTNVGQILGASDKNFDSSYSPFKPFFSKNIFLNIESDRLLGLVPNSWYYQDLKLVENNLITIKKIVHQQRSDLLLMIIPDNMQVDRKLLEEVIQKNKKKATDLDIKFPQNTLKKILDKNKIKYIDLLPYFLKESKPELLYQPQDTHFNSIGNEKTASLNKYY